MPDFYQTIVLRGTINNEALHHTITVSGVNAFFTPITDDVSVIFPEVTPTAPDIADAIAVHLSTLGTAFLVDVRNGDDTLRIRLFNQGQPIDEYIAEPGYLTGEQLPSLGGDASLWCSYFGVSDEETIDELSNILQANRYDEDYGYLTASERHREIATLLNLPVASIGIGYHEIATGRAPEDFRSVVDLFQVTVSNQEVRQYILLAPPSDAGANEIASYLHPEIIDLELGIEKEEWLSDLGTVAYLREAIYSLGPEITGTYWLHMPQEQNAPSVEIDLGTPNSDENISQETATLFVKTTIGEKSETLEPILQKIADTTAGTIWDIAARRIVVRSAVPS